MKSQNYKDLLVWQKSMDLVVAVYTVTDTFPENEKYGLTSQMRRCAVSIPSNIAEGSRRGTEKDFLKYIYIAYGSGAELETQMILSKRLFPTQNSSAAADNLLDEVMRMLNKLTQTLKAEAKN